MIGFDKENLAEDDPFALEIKKYCPGGVILFDRDFHDPEKIKNIRSPEQLRKLTVQIRSYASSPLLIAVDQEGGKVARLRPEDGFISMPSANCIGKQDDPAKAEQIYRNLAEQLYDLGINCNLAPVLELAVNPDNHIIVGLERSYGKSPEKVVKYARIFYDSLRSKGIISVFKHFPGHGSSADDSHDGFVDITHTWSPIELEPYKLLIREGRADMIMTAHVFNRYLDAVYPATLSYNIITALLRNRLGFKGVIVSDDMQMKAISDHYPLPQALSLAINAGINMLIFGNQLDKIYLTDIINIIYEEVNKGNTPVKRIIESNRLIENFLKKNSVSRIDQANPFFSDLSEAI